MVYGFFCLCVCLGIVRVNLFAFCMICLSTQRRENESRGTMAPFTHRIVASEKLGYDNQLSVELNRSHL